MYTKNSLIQEWNNVANETTKSVLTEIGYFSSLVEQQELQQELRFRVNEGSPIELLRWAIEILIGRYNRKLEEIQAVCVNHLAENEVQWKQEQD